MKTTALPDYREKLKGVLQERARKNPHYSLRAFARDLGIAPSRLSEILNWKKGVSPKNAAKIAKNLGFSTHEREVFLKQIESQHARSEVLRARAVQSLEEKMGAPAYSEIQMDHFKIVSDWYHMAILELFSIASFRCNSNEIAERLGITVLEARQALERLQRIGMILLKGGKLVPAVEFQATPSETPSEAGRSHHSQILAKADRALSFQSIEERDFSSLTMAIDPAQIPEAKALIKKFRRDLNALMDKAPQKSRVYCLSTQFFALDEKPRAMRAKKISATKPDAKTEESSS